MALYNFSLWTKAYPDITNRIQGSVLSWDGVTVIASIIDTTAMHPSRLWSYAGLPRANYKWSLDEIDGSGIIVRNLSNFDAVPSVIDGELTRNKEQLQVNAADSGLVSGLNTATLDGTDGKPDFRGWKIVIAPYGDIRNILVEGLDYTWVSDTGVFSLLQGEFFAAGAWWTFLFISQTQTQGNSAPTIFDYSTRLITTESTINYSDFGNAILVESEDTYIKVSIPSIVTIPVGRDVKVEIGGTGINCVEFSPFGTDTIGFLRGKLYGYSGESFIMRRYQHADLTNQWRVYSASGNFATAGNLFGANQIQSGILLAKLLNGSSESIFQYSRIYNEIVLNLPGTQVCTYANHATGNNKYLFSLEGTGGNAGKFFFPDLRGVTYKNNNAGKAGDFEDWALVDARHETDIYTNAAGVGAGSHFGGGVTLRGNMGTFQSLINGYSALTNSPCKTDGTAFSGANISTETKVKSVLINPYILI